MPSNFDADFENAFAPDIIDAQGESVSFFPRSAAGQRRGSRTISAVVVREDATRVKGRAINRRERLVRVTALDDATDGFTSAELVLGTSIRLAEDQSADRWSYRRTVNDGDGGMLTAEFVRTSLEEMGQLNPAEL